MKNVTKCLLFYLSITCIILLNSCGRAPVKHANDACIPPVERLAFPLDANSSSNEVRPEILPLGDWQFQAALPKASKRENTPQIIARSKEVWILPLLGTEVFRYRTDTKKWKTYRAIDTIAAVPRNLFLTRNEALWGLGVITKDLDSEIEVSFLSRYNDQVDQFESVRDIGGILDNVLVISSPQYVSEDEMGQFWFFASSPSDEDVGLYSFDPSSQKAEKHLSLPPGLVYAGPVAKNEDEIWFYSGGSERQLLKYSASTHQVEPYYGPPSFEEIGHITLLFSDKDGKIWLDNKGWLDFKEAEHPTWYEIIRSPVFLTDNGWYPNSDGVPSRYGWSVPFSISQSSNGWFWFTTIHGIIRLDPKKEEWCMFTTGSSPVVEDNEGNIWIVVFDKLYKYQLEQ